MNRTLADRAAVVQYYELRWPRISKTSREEDESDPVNNATLQAKAEEAMGTGGSRPHCAVTEAFDAFGIGDTSSASSSRATSTRTRQEELQHWLEKLEQADGIVRPDRGAISAQVPSRREPARAARLHQCPDVSRRFEDVPPIQQVAATAATTTSSPARPRVSHPLDPCPATMRRSYSSPAGRTTAPPAKVQETRHEQTDEATAHMGDQSRRPLKRKASKSPGLVGAGSKALRTGTGKVALSHALGSRATMPEVALPRSPVFVNSPQALGLICHPSRHVWTVLPPCPDLLERTPRHAALERSNFVKKPLDVLRRAGHTVPDISGRPSPPCPPVVPCVGYIFVVDPDRCSDELAELRKISAQSRQARVPVQLGQPSSSPQSVLVLRMGAYHTFGAHKAPDSEDVLAIL